MFWSKFRRRKSAVVQRIEAYTRVVPAPGLRSHVAVMFPATVEGFLLADQFERELQRRGIA